MKQLSVADRAVKTRRQIELVDEQLTKEFSTLPASVVHREVATVSEGLLADARFTEHVAVLTGRFVAEHLSVTAFSAQAPADVVIERSHHGPRFLGTFGTLADAEAYRAGVLKRQPAWEDVLTVRPHALAPKAVPDRGTDSPTSEK
jgi:hypothetical protein